jgi:hypothetical protein
MIDFGAGWLWSNGGQDSFVLKVSPNGAYQWAKRLNGQGDDQGVAIDTDNQGNVIAAGKFGGAMDFGGGPSTVFNSVQSGTDAYLVKYAP